MPISVSVRFYEELNDFLPIEKQKREFAVSLEEPQPVGRLIQSLDVPQSEVDLVLVNGESVSFSYQVQNGDRISAYPIFETLDISTVTKLRDRPLRKLKPT